MPLDENLCEQAFFNLVQNAYEAMGSEGGTFRVEVSDVSPNGHKGVQVRLKDSGPGVPPEMREQIFNPFVTTKKTGVGLGLSIVSKIVDEHQGTIRLENADEKGAGFVMFFPAVEEIRQASWRLMTSANATILIVEDEAKMRRLLELNLGDDGFRTLSAEDAEAGLKLLRKSVDLVITDLKLPGMNGLEFLQAVKRFQAALPWW